LDSVSNSGNANEAELFDDLTELEVDNHEKDGQRIIDGNIAESGEITNSDSNGRTGLKRRHRLVIDDEDDDE
jgi:timeless